MKEGRIRRAQQCTGIVLVIRIDTRSETDADQKLAALDDQRFLKGAGEDAPHARNLIGAAGVFMDHGEFIAPESGSEAVELGRLAQALRTALQDEVAEGVAPAV